MLFFLNIVVLFIGLSVSALAPTFFWRFIFKIYEWYYIEERFIEKNKIKINQLNVNSDQTEHILHHIVEHLSNKVGIQKPKIGIDYREQHLPRVATVGRSRKNATIIVSWGLLEKMGNEFTYKEIEAMIAHEIGHIINRDVSIITWASIYGYVTFYLVYPLSRYLEFKADETACKITGEPQFLMCFKQIGTLFKKLWKNRQSVWYTP